MCDTENSPVMVKVRDVTIIGEILNRTLVPKKIFEDTWELKWQTTLELEPGQNKISSGEYLVDYPDADETRWQIELNPNYVDEKGVRYLSVYLVLLKTCKEDTVISTKYKITLPSSRVDDRSGDSYSKNGGITKFSKEKPAHGFANYIEFYKLGDCTKPDHPVNLELVVNLSIFKDDPTPLSSEDVIFEVPTPEPLPRITKTESLYLVKDAYVVFDGDYIDVNSERLRQCTDFFNNYIIRKTPRLCRKPSAFLRNLEDHFTSKPLLRKIIDYCHTGKLETTVRWGALCNILKAAIQCNISDLEKDCQTEILKRLDVVHFIAVVDLARDKFLSQNEAYPVIYKFMIENIEQLEIDIFYQERYEDFKDFFNEIMLFCETKENEESKSWTSDVWLNYYASGGYDTFDTAASSGLEIATYNYCSRGPQSS